MSTERALSHARVDAHTASAHGAETGPVHSRDDTRWEADRAATPRPPGSTVSPAKEIPTPKRSAQADPYLALRVASEMYADAQKLRIALANRVRNAPIDPEVMECRLEGLRATERGLALMMRGVYRANVDPGIIAWQRSAPGIGEHLLARLLGAIGHPVLTTVHRWEGEGEQRELVVVGTMRRRVSDLWSYCGHGDPARRRRRGMGADDAMGLGNPQAKMLVRLLAEACVKARQHGSPYAEVYDAGRVRYADRDWTPGHQHNAALRLAGKEILRDLWRAGGGADAEMPPASAAATLDEPPPGANDRCRL